MNASTADHQFGCGAHLRQIGQDLARRRVDVEAHARRRLPSGHHRGHDCEIAQAGVGARSDYCLGDFLTGHLADRHHVAR